MLSCCAGPRNDQTDPVKMRVHMPTFRRKGFSRIWGMSSWTKRLESVPAKHHIGREKQQPPGQTRMIFKPPVTLFKQKFASLRNPLRESSPI